MVNAILCAFSCLLELLSDSFGLERRSPYSSHAVITSKVPLLILPYNLILTCVAFARGSEQQYYTLQTLGQSTSLNSLQ
jgi:hypothetical protein